MPISLKQTPKPRRVAVVGGGFFSQFHLDAWAKIPGVELVGLCDVDEEKAKQLGSRFGVQRAFSNMSQMLDSVKPDLVDVVTPPVSHESILSEIIARGLPIICQKPFGVDYAQALAFTEKAEKGKVLLAVHENFRFMPWYREMRRLIDIGFFGDMHGVSFRLRPGDGQGPSAYLDRQPYFQTMPRLLIAETAIHFIDTFRYLMGDVQAVYARLRRINPAIQAEDAGIICFEFKSGASGLFDGNRLNDHSAENTRRTMGEMWLEGSKGVMRLDGLGALHWMPHHGVESPHLYDAKSQDNSFGAGACGALQLHVLNHLEGAQALENSARDYLENLRIQEATYLSHSLGQRINMLTFEKDYSGLLSRVPERFVP